MAKEGFKNQWIAISRVGQFADSANIERDLNEDFLKQVVANFTPHDAPAVIGHPKDNTPAFGWASALRLMDNGVLEAQFADVDDEFEAMVEAGKFRKRSASFYLNPPSLRHVGFLGAMPPAVKGLKNIQFAEGETVTFENSFNLNEEINMGLEDKDVEKVTDGVFEKIKSFFKPEVEDKPTTANFSEADLDAKFAKMKDQLKAEAKAEATAEFSEQLKTLQESVNAQSASGKRAEIVNFVEGIPAEKGKHFLKRAGIVEFMESLADDDAADAISFAEGDVTHKFSRLDWFKNYVNAQQNFVEFGEKFGDIKATAAADVMIDQNSLDEMRKEMGIKDDGGAK